MAFLTSKLTTTTHRFGTSSSCALARRSVAPQNKSVRPFSFSLLRASKVEASSTKKEDAGTPKKVVPVTLLSGFLGTGKTSALTHLLENKEDLKIGVIVNDVASVNIDAKLIAGQSGDMIELQNGCACCSLSDELFFSVEKLITGRDLDALVVELSGVADPMAIKQNWIMAPEGVKNAADMSRVVTVIDAASFGTDYMTWDTAFDREDWVAPGDDCAGMRKVAELLAEQVEAADLILINKCDLADEEQIKVSTSVARALNEKAELREVEYGRIGVKSILGTSNKKEDALTDCHDADCNDPSHSHSHSHNEHASSHSHDHSDHGCSDPDCTDSSHSHEHNEHSCNDPDCDDPSHSHSHSHASTTTDDLGLVNFVYKASRPFNGEKLMKILQLWPVPVKDTLDIEILKDATKDGYEVRGKKEKSVSPFVGVLRSKGFCWFAPQKWSGANDDSWRHDTAMYWSHAGRHFGISTAGKFWATLPDNKMKKYFAENMAEYERIKREDFVSEEFGDRRQEIVFIGTNLDEEKITAALDGCLVTEEEMDTYRQKLNNYMQTVFTSSSPGLFGVGTMDHTDM